MSPTATPPQKPARQRLDQLLVERGLAETRAKAQALVLAGQGQGGGGRRRPARPQGRRPRRRGDAADRARGARAVRQPRRPQARGRARRLRDRPGGLGLPRRRGVDRRLHRRPAPARRAARLRRRRRARPARRVASPRRAGRLDGADERPDARPRRRSPEPVGLAVIDVSFISLGLVLGPGRRDAAARRRRPDRRPRQAAVRGRPGQDGPRRRPRPGVHREVLERVVGGAGDARAWARAASSPRRSSGRRATASSSSTSRRGPAAPRSTT